MSSLIKKNPSRLTTLTGYYAFIVIGWNGVLIPSLIRSIEHDFHQNDAGMGLLYFISAVVYGAGAMGGGFLTERLGREVVLPGSAVVLALGLGIVTLAPSWPLLILGSAMGSWGAGSIDGGTNGLFLDLFRQARGGAMNLLHTFFSVGSFTAPFAIGTLVSLGVNWRGVPLAAAVCALLLATLFYLASMPSGRHSTVAVEADVLAPSERTMIPFVGLALAIGLYVAAEVGVSNWVVRFLSNESVATATAVLSIFWIGLALGRFASNWIAERLDYYVFTVSCIALSSLSLVAAVLVPWFPLSAALFGLTGLFSGPIFPMIMTLGGDIYPHRLAALSGSLAAAAAAGGIVYPPLMGIMAASVGLRVGLLGAAMLGIPEALGLLAARRVSASEPQPVAID